MAPQPSLTFQSSPLQDLFPQGTFLSRVPQTHLRFCRFPRTLPRKHCSKHYHHCLPPASYLSQNGRRKTYIVLCEQMQRGVRPCSWSQCSPVLHHNMANCKGSFKSAPLSGGSPFAECLHGSSHQERKLFFHSLNLGHFCDLLWPTVCGRSEVMPALMYE